MTKKYFKIFSGILLFISAGIHAQMHNPIVATGFTIDGVAETLPAMTTTSMALDGSDSVLYSKSYAVANSISGGLLDSGEYTGSDYNFKLQPYNTNNLLKVTSGTVATLTFTTPKSYTSLKVLGFSTEGNSTFNYTVNFTDGTNSSGSSTFFDWFNNTPFVVQGLGNVSRNDFSPGNINNPRLYQNTITLNGGNEFKMVQSITFIGTQTSFPRLYVMAVSGLPTLFTCPSDIVVQNDMGKCGAIVNYSLPIAAKSKPKVLVLAISSYSTSINDVQQKLAATNAFSTVDAINAYSTTVTLAMLEQYDAILFFTNVYLSNSSYLGDILALYIESGGGVVDALAESVIAYSISGAYNSDTYRVLNPGSYLFTSGVRTLGTVLLPSHPIMNGVTSFNGGVLSMYSTSTSTASNVYTIANYDNGSPLILARENVGALNAKRVSLNFFPPSANDSGYSNSWLPTTDGAKIMANALLWTTENAVQQTTGLASGTLFPVGITTNSFEFTDKNNAVQSCSFTVTVNDTELPTVKTQNISIALDATGNAVITAAQINNSSTDNCGVDTLVLDITAFDCTNLGDNTVTLTVTDINGNSNTGTAIVTITDAILPVAMAQNIAVQLDATGNAVITPADIDNGSSDNCTFTLSLDNDSFNCTNLGDNTVTLTVTDSSNNIHSATATVTVEDNIAPVAVTQNIIVLLDATGNVVITPADIDNGSSDNCTFTLSLDSDSFNCTNLGDNTVTLTVTDSSNNIHTATATVTVEDNIAPVVVTQNITVQLDATGNAVIIPADIDNGSSDNCAVDTVILDITAFNCTNLGPNTVILTVTDVNGNSATETAIVTVQDSILPIAIAQNITVNLDAVTGLTTITPIQIDNGSSDNCTFQLSLDSTDFDCNDIGANTVQLTVTDAAGNIATATAVVTVQDITAPTVITQPFTIPLNPNGEILLVPAQVDGGSFDNCGIVTRSVTPNLFYCADRGDHTVTLTVTDASGNSSSATAIVTVIDNIKPVVVAQNIIVPLGAAGTVTVTPQQVNNGSTDNCGIDSMSLDIFNFDCTNIGDHNVILSVTDVGGNTATATAIITIIDNTGPIITPVPVTLFLDANGEATLTVANVANNVTDNCGIQSIILNKTAFSCINLGTNKVTVTATDVNNNVTKQIITVIIEDNIAPVATAQNITVALDTTGFATITPDMINNGSTDNCAIDSMSLDITSFTCTNAGPNTVTLTVKDKAGNTNTTTAVVTVLPVPVPVFTNLSQTFCAVDEPVIADITVNSDLVVWYSDATSTKEIATSTILVSGTYYAATRYKFCYSDRVAVTITINDSPAPTGEEIQYVCLEEKFTITSLVTNQEEVIWYDTPTGGMPLSDSTELEHKKTYYASYIGTECESSKRLAVDVIIRHCDVVIHNAVSANGDGRNDYFAIEGAETFTDNKLEIFNRWGGVVFETTRYGLNGNLFKGNANTGLSTSGGLLPFGTYYYVFSFTNHDGNRITKTGFLHLNN